MMPILHNLFDIISQDPIVIGDTRDYEESAPLSYDILPMYRPLTIMALSSNVSIRLSNTPYVSLGYSISCPKVKCLYNIGDGWKDIDLYTESIQLSKGMSVQLRGNNEALASTEVNKSYVTASWPYDFTIADDNFSTPSFIVYGADTGCNQFEVKGLFAVSGNPASLLKKKYLNDLPKNAFFKLFYNNDGLIDASNVYLDHNMNDFSCAYMFSKCDNLKCGPKHLSSKAMTHVPYAIALSLCYFRMFDWCYGMETRPSFDGNPSYLKAMLTYDHTHVNFEELTESHQIKYYKWPIGKNYYSVRGYFQKAGYKVKQLECEMHEAEGYGIAVMDDGCSKIRMKVELFRNLHTGHLNCGKVINIYEVIYD